MHCDGSPHLLFTDNDTNTTRLFGAPGPQYAKDGINEAVVHGREDAVNPSARGHEGGGPLRVRGGPR